MACRGDVRTSIGGVVVGDTRRVPVQRAVERDEIPYPCKVHDTTLHSRA